ncbi:hypothetical protein LSCM4_02632 [Leishmania orientalis]|uniref:Uncharacterized protein n=1 Tax=Leishmania orientalis TaxID=2249476 RepID=A0A836KAF7_9TRYP|nr:hypothetical protein LSCM4_02632 [Leishmania orientalis]
MTSVAGTTYRAEMHRVSVVVETAPEARRLGIRRGRASSLMKSGHTTERNITAVTEWVGETNAQSASQLLNGELEQASHTRDTEDSGRRDRNSFDQPREALCRTGGFTNNGSGSSESSYTSSYITSTGYESIATADSRPPPSNGAYDEVDEEVEEVEAMVICEASRIISNSSGSSRISLGKYSIMPEMSHEAVSPEHQSDIKAASSASSLPPAMAAGARGSQGSAAYSRVMRTLEKRTRRASGSASSRMAPPACTSTVLNQKLGGTHFVFSASDSFSDRWSALSEDRPIDLGKEASGKAGARRSKSLELQKSIVFSQLNLSLVPERHRAEELTPSSDGFGFHRSGDVLRTPSVGDNAHWTVRPMQKETVQQRRAHSDRASRDAVLAAGGLSGLWSSNDENSEDAMSRRQSDSKMNSTFPSFTAYFYARSKSTMGGETRRPSSGAKLVEAPRKTSVDESSTGRKGKRSASTKGLPQCFSFFGADAGDGGSLSGNALRVGRTSAPNAFVRVLRGDFDNGDVSLDSRLLVSDHSHKAVLTSVELKGPRRPQPVSSGHTVASDGAANGCRANVETAGINRASSDRRVDGSVRHRPSGNANLSIFGGAFSGNMRGSFSVTRSSSSGPVQGLVSVTSQQTLLGGWRLLSFRDRDDTPLTSVEHVAHSGKSKKRHKKDKKGRRHKKHCTSRHAAENGHEGNGARSGEPATHKVLKDEDCHGNAARMPQERDRTQSQAEANGVTAAGETHFSTSSPGGFPGVSQERCGVRSRGDANRQLLERQRAALHNHILQPQPPETGLVPDSAGKQMRILLSRTPVHTVSVTSDTRFAGQSPHASAEKSGRPAANTHVPQRSGAGAVHAARGANDGVARNLVRSEEVNGPRKASPSATARGVTVLSGMSRVSMPDGFTCTASGSVDGGVRRLRVASPLQGRQSILPPNGRLPVCVYGGVGACDGQPTRHSPASPPEGLPPL